MRPDHSIRLLAAAALLIGSAGAALAQPPDPPPFRSSALPLLAIGTRQRRRDTAGSRHQPEIVGVEKDDVRGTDVRIAQHAGVRLDLSRRGHDWNNECEDKSHL